MIIIGEPSQFLIQERTYLAFQEQDDTRRAYLDDLIHKNGHCHYCGSEVTDRSLMKHPGVCSACVGFAKRGEQPKLVYIRGCRKKGGRPTKEK